MMKSKFLLITALLFGFGAVGAHAEVSDAQFSDMMKKYLATPGGQKELGVSVETYFKSRQQEALKEEESRAQAEMENQFKSPVSIELGGAPVKGPAAAKVTIVEFSDFQCPFCRRGNDTMTQVMKMYPNDVKVAFMHKPLPMHPEAEPAAKASSAAGKQGKFWEMHDALFANQDKLAAAFYDEQAQKLGLNVEQFKKDMASPEIEKIVKDQAALADKLGVQGTPNFFVNGVAVRGAYPAEHFKKIVDRWLSGPAKK